LIHFYKRLNMVTKQFFAGDLVFAKVKGYPPWPARITGVNERGRFSVFFYGTYENATMKSTELFHFSKENQENFIPKNSHRKHYLKGVEEIRNTPEIAPGPDEADDAVFDVPVSLPAKRKSVIDSPVRATSVHHSPAAVVRKPLKLSDGTTLKRAATAVAADSATPNKDTSSTVTPSSERCPPKIARMSPSVNDQSQLEDSNSSLSYTPQTSSRSGRVIKQKRFSDDLSRGNDTKGDTKSDSDALKLRTQLQIEDPRKIWVKKRSTGDMIEIQLDKEKPDRWESHHQKLTWCLSTARNAVKLKQFVELGEFVPDEIVQNLKEKTILSKEDKEQLKKIQEQHARRAKVEWLLREHELVEIDLEIKKSLPAKEPDTDECVRLLQCLLRMDIDKLMIVKQPFVPETVCMLRKYQGPDNLSLANEKDRERLKRNIKSIQTMAETAHKKIQALFNFRETQTSHFSDYLQTQITRYHKITSHLKPTQKLTLTKYPE